MMQSSTSPRSSDPAPRPLRVLVTGANGMIGHALLAHLRGAGLEAVGVQRPVRKPSRESEQPAPASPGAILWEPEAAQPFADLELLEGFDAVVHLAGANISAHRWTPEYKKKIVGSRTLPTGALALTLARLRQPPRVLLTASATGFYGSRGDELLNEQSPAGRGFLPEVCEAWENAAAPAVAAGIRVAHLRFGVVLTPFGGALKQMLPLFRLGLGGNLSNGRQWMSWIGLGDLLKAVLHVIQHEDLQGPVNIVSPQPVRNAELTRALGKAMKRPAVLPAPAFALRLAFGQMAEEALLASCRAVPSRLEESGFHFAEPEIAGALGKMLATSPPV